MDQYKNKKKKGRFAASLLFLIASFDFWIYALMLLCETGAF